ncbi:uncharacterized protein N7479_000741 [Penicillium vulpinum]|nr:uncharacterized protein N7479_000741 [Penicillium vulpinum]KAJ5970823.1 hypothetical protein N7479_000741 [Penicillium vulpinum]
MPPLDGPPANISRALVGHGIDVPIALRVATDSVGSIATYQTWLADPSIDFVKIMDNIYELGFHEVDVPDHNGQTPLMMFYPPRISEDTPVVIKSAAWLVSKGASVDRKLPRSNANAAHLLTAQVINCHFRGVLHQSDSSDYRNWKKGVAELGDACFFIPPSQDGCICACSPGGCTTLSVALRAIIFMISKWQLKIQDDCLRILICSLVVWQDSWPDLLRAIVRALTFDALGLTHTCCTEIDQVEENFPPDVFLNKGRDETEISRILDDQRLLVKEFEELTEEMESKLDELGLPLEEFLDGYWYDRVIEYLLRRDHYDEEHVTEARKMGIFLEPEEFCIPDRVSLQFRPRLQHLQDNSSQEDRQ